MTIVNMKAMLNHALENEYAVPQFNLNGLPWAKAFLKSAQAEQSPVIIAASDRVVDFLGGFSTIFVMVNELMKEYNITVPVALHLDHGRSVERCKAAIDAGFTSVMIDGSHATIAENIEMTKAVTSYAHSRGVTVEAEVGTVGGNEDGLIGGIQYAKLEDCVALVEETGVDALAAALGSVHGQYVGEPKLGFKEMSAISVAVGIPLVLHGASGIPEDQVKRAIKLGHAKININTENNIAFAEVLRHMLAKNQTLFDPQAYLNPGQTAIEVAAIAKMREFGSSGKA
ncbi:fructose-1,6-bisphosphate aldolase, class II [Brochothrix thermosphacta]|uniref:class II fructose-1,6-bisphosphate aldolase n=1 Tax=Brochothrix thermosphacta TaxID=2756 RepID=UPI000E733E6A|nr:class II fructose-1,6-bisphosphate aldolase [Brochothrix thermosphacta]ANZ94245.1 fructose-1,6-bisphosphate aldolase, class II [Brochothrix thermosphacta]